MENQGIDKDIFDGLKERTDKLERLNDTFKKPIKIDVPKKIDMTEAFVTAFLNRLKGENGKDGKDGNDGTNGKDGIDGKDGKNGIDGIDGLNGIDGKDGRDGKDLDKEEVITEVINRITQTEEGKDVNIKLIVEHTLNHIKQLKGNDRIDISHIRNSEQILGKLNKIDFDDQRWHGGGAAATKKSYEEIPTDSGDHINFTIANTPIVNTFRLYRGGARQNNGVDYTLTGTALVLTIELDTVNSEVIFCDYEYL
jgi:hypothetical protein